MAVGCYSVEVVMVVVMGGVGVGGHQSLLSPVVAVMLVVMVVVVGSCSL